MKKILTLVCLIGFTGTAFAGWQEDFDQTYKTQGIEAAVMTAVRAGKAPTPIVKKGMAMRGVNPQRIVKALFCAGANGQDIMSAAAAGGISEMMVGAGQKSAVGECGDEVVDTQAYGATPVRRGPVFNPPPSGGRGRVFVSISRP